MDAEPAILSLLGQTQLQHLLAPVGALLIALALLMRYRQKYRLRTGQNRLTPHEERERARQVRGMRGDLEQLMVEVEQLAKRFANQLDAKALQMEKLLADADERISRLQQLGQPEPEAAGSSAPPVADRPPTAAPPNADPKAQQVYSMADAGLNPVDIAEALNEQIGNVELILALRQEP